MQSNFKPKFDWNAKKSSDPKYVETYDKTREILRLVVPINKSGSKQLVLGADPSTGFQPSLTLKKPGFPGIKLNGSALEKFIACFKEIDEYFKSGGMQNMELVLSKDRSIKFGHHYKDKAVFLKMAGGETNEDGYSIVLNSFTWPFLMSMHSLVNYTYQSMKTYAPELLKIFNTLKTHLASKVNMKGAINPEEVENVLNALEGNEIEIIADPDLSMDYVRAFYEMKRFCIYDIMCSSYNE